MTVRSVGAAIPELYARITEKLVFNRLNYDVQMEIARLHITHELAFLRNKGVDLSIADSVVGFIKQHGFHCRLGARPLRDTIEKQFRGAVVDAVSTGKVGARARLVVRDSKLALS
ncbi:MAG TPA: hypothetical protein VFA61_12855 [Candidatus Udaeobacter sp.]|nr:hypothetical protein [Candidatus Udaeobacter sp.]